MSLQNFTFLGLLLTWIAPLAAAEFSIRVLDPAGQPIPHAVASLTPTDPSVIPKVPATQAPAVMDQVNRQFKPYVLPVQAGQKVTFPNSDSIKHHVYSFSKAKPFQLRLYKDRAPKPLAFEKPGIVALGCNIHDWMIGYIYVAESPWFGKTSPKGETTFEVPEGEYQLRVWHPLMKEADLNRVPVMTINEGKTLEWTLQEPLLSATNQDGPVDEFDDY